MNGENTPDDFLVDLKRYIGFYDDLSMSIIGFVRLGAQNIINFDSYVYSSMKGTLESIKDIVAAGRIGDAYALLRRFHDSATINIYSSLYLEDNFTLENRVVEKINDWLQGKAQIPEFRIMSDYIRRSARVSMLNELIYSDHRYKEIRDRCNSFTHYNFFEHVLLNDSRVFVRDRADWSNRLRLDLRDLFIFHIAYLFLINDHYMMSSDYVDCLECGMAPEEGAEYWVAPFIQDVFTEILVSARPDLAIIVRNNSQMKLRL